MKRGKTPQEKKVLSYSKDRRNVYGENNKASRKNIPLRKAKENRAYRKKVNEILNKTQSEIDLGEMDLIENKAKSIKNNWKKCADAPLKEVVKSKLKRRKDNAGKGKTARKKIREVIKNLEIKTSQDINKRWLAKSTQFQNIKAYGETKEESIEKLKYFIKMNTENAFGFNVGILVDGNYEEPILDVDDLKKNLEGKK